MLKHLVVLVSLIFGVYGCADIPAPTVVTNSKTTVFPEIIRWSANPAIMQQADSLWLAEASKRFHDPIIFICHGGFQTITKKDVDGGELDTLEWWLYPDPPRHPMPVQSAADTLADLYPDRDIVLVVCNEFGHDLHTKHVFYAREKVWLVPDDYTGINTDTHETTRGFDTAGSIWEFVSYDGSDNNYPTKSRFVFKDTPTTKSTTQPATKPIAK